MGGLYATSPGLSALFLLLVVTVAGVPPFLSFWPKLLLLQGSLDGSGLAGEGAPSSGLALPLAGCLLANALLSLYAGARLWSLVFWRPAPNVGDAADAALRLAAIRPAPQRVSIGALALLAIVIFAGGIWPEPLLSVAKAAAATLLDPRPYVAAVGLGASP
jgi:multicomponent Na+:H+ antiporter subunit D